MKRIFTSFLMLAVSFIASIAFAAEPTYGVPQGSRNQRVNDQGSRYTERLLHTFSLSGATVNGESKSFSSTINKPGASQREVFLDHTQEIVELSAGDQITIGLQHDIIWMHSYLYIDYNHDGVFDEDNELVSYSFYSENESSQGLNSAGVSVQHDVNPSTIPGFTVDSNATTVTTRMRLKIDWNSKDPIGNPKQSIGANAGTIVDFTVKIYGKQVAAKVPVTLNESVNGTYKVLNVAGEEIKKGQEVEIGSQLKVVPTPAEGYRLKDILVNGNPVNANELFTVEGETSIQVAFEEDVQMWTLTYEATQGGSVSVLGGNGALLNNGDKIKDGEVLGGCKFAAEAGYKLVSVLVNGLERVDQCMTNPITHQMLLELPEPVHSNVHIEAFFRSESAANQFAVTWNEPDNGTVFVVKTNGEEITNGQKVDEGTNLLIVANPTEGYRLKEILVNGVANNGEPIVVTEETNIVVTFEAAVPTHIVNITANAGGSVVVLTDAGDEVYDGQAVDEGTMLKVVATPEDGYVLKSILVNGTKVENNSSFALLKATTIEFKFVVADKWTVNIETTEGGSVSLLDANGQVIKSGSKLENGTMIEGCQIITNQGYTLTSVCINDEELVNSCLPIAPNVYMLEIQKALLGDFNMVVVFSAETGITEAALAEAAYNAGTQSLNIPAGAYAVVYNTAGQQVMNVQGGQTVSTSSLAHGAYVVRVVAEGGVKVIKFVQK